MFDILIPKLSDFKPVLNSLYAIPVSAGIEDSQGRYLGCNQYTADLAGKISPKEIEGYTDQDLIWNEYANIYKEHNNRVEQSQKPRYFLEPSRNGKNETIHLISIRAPLINYTKSISGILGICIPLIQSSFQMILSCFFKVSELLSLTWNNQLLIQLITKGMQLNQLQTQWQSDNQLFDYGKVVFTFREAQCLHYFFHHYTAEQTAQKLCISRKTVEFHIANIKLKINCNGKSQITNKAIDLGFIDLMFIRF